MKDNRTLNEIAAEFGLSPKANEDGVLTEGYTHYYPYNRGFTQEEWDKIVKEAKRLFAAAKAKGISIKGGNGSGSPIANDQEIIFNGDASKKEGEWPNGEDHETFALTPENPGDFQFCKTAQKPYDAVVVSLLAFIKQIAKDALKISSDGGNSAIKKVL